ncbi:extracellular serine-threonine rich protein, partial [Aspergillus homomorphus CBS 101889]
WGTDESFTSPDNTETTCSAKQQAGFDWSDLAVGSLLSSYDGFEFSGFSVSNNFSTASDDQVKSIVGKLTKDSSASPKISSASKDQDFSINDFQLATSRDADIRIVYSMADGTTCNSLASVSVSGTDVTNDQCGGATS